MIFTWYDWGKEKGSYRYQVGTLHTWWRYYSLGMHESCVSEVSSVEPITSTILHGYCSYGPLHSVLFREYIRESSYGL